jgi:6-phosphogluconolactonase (cycloisomerase 2 family)
MSSQPAQFSLVLIRRLADGTDEWIDLEIPQRMPATPGANYALIDRGAGYEAPQTLMAQRQGENLVIEVSETEVLTLDGFFAAPDAAFYPTTDIASGAGPFSGSLITPNTPILASSAGAQVVWAAQPVGPVETIDSYEQSEGSGNSAMLLGGLAAGGLGLALLGGGGGGGGGGSASVPLDTVAPRFTSGSTAPAIDDSSGAGKVVYIATATDSSPVAWSLATTDDGADFNIDATTGAVTLLNNPDFETKSSYTFTVIATDDAGNSSQQAVSLSVTDTDDSAPIITSGTTAPGIDENSGADQVVYTATAADSGPIIWSLAVGSDAAAFSINPNSGAVTLLNNPDFEAQSSYTFSVVATDETGNSSQQAVSLSINDLVENSPIITSGDTAPAIDENSGDDQVVYTATATDNGPIIWSLAVGGDAAAFSINPNSGAVTLLNSPNFETQSSYTFSVVATDETGNSSQQSVSLAINNLDEIAPTLSSSNPADNATAVPVDDDIVLRFSENVQSGSGNITISDGNDTRTININDDSRISISGNRVTIDPGSDLNPGSTYNVQIDADALLDDAGNGYAGISNSRTLNFDTETGIDTSIVVFDLTERSSSDHSDRTFQSGVSYDIYIRVESDDSSVRLGNNERWEGAANLGSDDRVILVGDGAAIEGPFLPVNQVSVGTAAVEWSTGFGFDAGVLQGRSFTRATGLGGRDNDDVRLFETSLPAAFLGNQGGQTNTMYLTDMPAGILTSQGLA